MTQLATELDLAGDEVAQARADLVADTPHPSRAIAHDLARLRDDAWSVRGTEAGRLARELTELAEAVRAAADNYAALDDRLKGL